MAGGERRSRRATQMRLLVTTLAVMASGAALAEQTAGKLTLYKTVSSAACSDDQTIWADPETQTYYLKGDKLYGKTRRGGYNCRRQADAAGYRAFGTRGAAPQAENH